VLIKYFNTASVDDMFNFLLEQMNILKNIAENFSATHMNPIHLNSSFFHVPMDVHCKLILLFVNEYKRHIENFLNSLLPPLLACI